MDPTILRVATRGERRLRLRIIPGAISGIAGGRANRRDGSGMLSYSPGLERTLTESAIVVVTFLRKTSGKHVKGDIKSVGSIFPQNSWVSFLGGCPMAPTGFGASFKGVLAITVFPRLCPKREFLFWV